MEKTYIVVRGNVVDGLTFIGPFVTMDDAVSYGDKLFGDWVTAPVEQPEVR